MPFEIRTFTGADLKRITEINRPSESRLCAHRLARGHYGFIATNHNQAAGYAWGCAEIDSQLERVPIKLNHGDILCNDAFTVPAYRGMGVQTALTLTRLKLFHQAGYKRAICYIENGNYPSIYVWQQKLKSTIIGQIDFKRIGAWYQVKISGIDE
jgi:GNAT superfamily N-acetyltransferase